MKTFIAAEAELKELKYVGIKRIRLEYLKDSKRKMGFSLWNLLEPRLPGYTYDGGFPTFSEAGLRERGILR